ncbi:MAG: peptidoglycan-binding protein LysM [Gammaproteobacteria bacterium]
MGLLDFAADIGKKLFGAETDAAAAIKKLVEEDNPGIENFRIDVKKGRAVLSGAAKSAEALEKVILIVGNTQGIEKINIDAVTITDGSALGGEDEFYIIEKGDTLWKIAESAYGNGAQYQKIFEANREVIKDADKIFPGQKIRIPKT